MTAAVYLLIAWMVAVPVAGESFTGFVKVGSHIPVGQCVTAKTWKGKVRVCREKRRVTLCTRLDWASWETWYCD